MTYSPDGFLKASLVSENDLPIGIYAPDGSIRVTTDPGLGLYAPNGAWRISDENTSSVYTVGGNLNGYVVAGVLYTPDRVRHSAAATTLFQRMTTQPTGLRKKLYDDLLTALTMAAVLSLLDVLYVTAAHNAQAAGINLVSPSYTLSPVAAPTFTANSGYQGNGTTQYLDTGYQPGVSAGSRALQDSNSMGAWSLTNLTAATTDIGNTNNSISSRSTTSGMATRNMSATVTSTATANSLGLTSMARTAAGTYRAGRNGVKLADIAVASSAPTAASLYLLGRNNAGVLATPSTRAVAAAYSGAYLTEAQELALYNALSTYLTAVGAI